MACEEQWLEVLSAWHDGEASADEVARARAHLPGCPACRGTRERFELLRAALRSAPDGARGGARAEHAPRPSRLRRLGRRAVMGGAFAAAVVASLLVPRWVHPTGVPLVDEVEERHLTAFAKAAPCDFQSSDPEAVKAWVTRHLGYDVDVPLVPGARLLGVRRCRLSGEQTVSLMYRRGDEPLSVFLARAGTSAETETARLARGSSACTVARLGAAVCARPGFLAVAETTGSANVAVGSF